jgi:hypothetical protein
VSQTKQVGRVIVVGSGQDISEIVQSYEKKLKVEYYHSQLTGQINQRILGISKLDSRTRLVATIDDDIIFENNSFEKMINCWNSAEDQTKGIGFNVINIPENNPNFFKNLLYIGHKVNGKVLKSGFVTQLPNTPSDQQVDWLSGGCAIWDQNTLLTNIHKDRINARWSPCEDLLFSYPIGRKFKLFVCKESKCFHDDVYYGDYSFKDQIYRGKMLALWNFFFVSSYRELSGIKCLIANLSFSLFNLIKSLFLCKFKLAIFYLTRISFSIFSYCLYLKNSDFKKYIY